MKNLIEEAKQVNTEIGKRVKQKRLEKHLSQDELATRVGCKHRSSVSKIEKGKQGLTIRTLILFAEALNCSPAYLAGWIEHDNP